MRRGFSRLLLGIRSLGGLLLVLVLIETTQLREILNGPDMNLREALEMGLPLCILQHQDLLLLGLQHQS